MHAVIGPGKAGTRARIDIGINTRAHGRAMSVPPSCSARRWSRTAAAPSLVGLGLATHSIIHNEPTKGHKTTEDSENIAPLDEQGNIRDLTVRPFAAASILDLLGNMRRCVGIRHVALCFRHHSVGLPTRVSSSSLFFSFAAWHSAALFSFFSHSFSVCTSTAARQRTSCESMGTFYTMKFLYGMLPLAKEEEKTLNRIIRQAYSSLLRRRRSLWAAHPLRPERARTCLQAELAKTQTTLTCT
jgi:hypothetical protein